MLEFILKAGSLVDPVSEPEGLTPLALAVRDNHLDAMKVLIQHGAYVDCDVYHGTNIFGLAVSHRHVEAARLLIDSGLNLNARVQMAGLQAIHQAAFVGLDELVGLLLDKGVDIESPTSVAGLCPLMLAAYSGRTSTVRLLLDRGADPHAKDALGKGLLAAAMEHPALIRFVLSLGIDVNSRDHHGSTALHETAIWDSDIIASAKVLLQRGAKQFHTELIYEDDIERTNPHSGTPAKIARERGRIALAELLEDWNYDECI